MKKLSQILTTKHTQTYIERLIRLMMMMLLYFLLVGCFGHDRWQQKNHKKPKRKRILSFSTKAPDENIYKNKAHQCIWKHQKEHKIPPQRPQKARLCLERIRFSFLPLSIHDSIRIATEPPGYQACISRRDRGKNTPKHWCFRVIKRANAPSLSLTRESIVANF